MLDITELISIRQISGSISSRGWTCEFESLNDTDLFEENQNIAITWSPYQGKERQAFRGYITSRRVSFTGSQSVTRYTANTTNVLLQGGWLQGIYFKDVGATGRANYHEFDNTYHLTMGRMILHILGYMDELAVPDTWLSHTNVAYHATGNPAGWVDTSGIEDTVFDTATNPEGSMRVDSYIVDETDNLWNTIQGIAANEFFVAYFDKADRIHYRRHPMFALSTPDAVIDFDESMIIGAPEVELRSTDNISQVILHAVTDQASVLHSTYPDLTSVAGAGRRREISHLRCNNQATLDAWANFRYKYLTRDATVTITLPGASGLLFDLLDRVTITYTGTSVNGVHFSWASKAFYVHDIVVEPQGNSQLTLEAENT
jgi:hypothetical protein